MTRVSVLAVGGSALAKLGQRGTLQEQVGNCKVFANVVSRFARTPSAFAPSASDRICIVHGNGPQVGNIERQQEAFASEIPPFGLDCAVAMTQGSLGYLLGRELVNRFRTDKLELPVANIVTQVVVDRDDPACSTAVKPVGRYYTEDVALQLQRELGWAMKPGPSGWRQIVPSPRPKQILNLQILSSALSSSGVLLAGGGGGIPVVENVDGDLEGLNAVIDKDFTAALVAQELNAGLLVLLTNAPKVCTDFGLSSEAPIDRLTLQAAKSMLDEGQFLPGTMRPKMESAIHFLESSSDGEVLVCTADDLLNGDPATIGTRITRE